MAVQSVQPLKISLTAGGDLSSSQYRLVKLDTSGNAVLCSGTTDIPVGVLQNNPTSGKVAEVTVIGYTKISADTSLAIGDLFGTSADGQATPLVAGTDTTKYVIGRMLTAAGAAGVVGSALVNCANPHRGA